MAPPQITPKPTLKAPMTAGRKPLNPPATIDLDDTTIDQDKVAGAMAQMRADVITQHEAEKDEVLAAGIDLGRLEALDFIATVANSAILPIYENVKKSKAWRLLRNPKSSNGSNFASLDEFCEVKLGKTYGRLQHLVANRNVIGQEAFEQAERLGLRQVDYNAIKALPAPDQELIRRAVEEAQSSNEVLDLLQELAARHATEKEAMARQVEEATAEAKAGEEVRTKLHQRIDKLEREKALIERMPPDEALEALMKEATAITRDALGSGRGNLRQALQSLLNAGEERGQNNVFMAGLVGQVQAELNALREEFNLPDVSTAADQQL